MAEIIPWHSDVVQRPVKFVKQGGVFVCGGFHWFDEPRRLDWVIWRGTASSAARVSWTQVFSKQQSTYYYPYCGAYGAVGSKGTPTFVMAGRETYSVEGDTPFDRISILTSGDGKSWSESYGEKDGFALAAAWDAAHKRFLVQCITDAGINTFNVSVFASNNGRSWGRIETKEGYQTDIINPPSALLTNTGTSLVKDMDGYIVPNGSYFGLNPGATIITPTVMRPFSPQNPITEATSAIEIIKREVNPSTGAVTIRRTGKSLAFPVLSVAYAGGIYIACGTSSPSPGEPPFTGNIVSSGDTGASWKSDLTLADHSATCVLASGN